MAAENQIELQLLPIPSTVPKLDGGSGLSSSVDLQLSISLQPIRPAQLDCVVLGPPSHQHYAVPKSELSCIEALKWQTAEQIRLTAIEKAYAEKVRELTRREMELAQTEFARARYIWERAKEDMQKADRLREISTRHIDDSSFMEITCYSCHRRFLSS